MRTAQAAAVAQGTPSSANGIMRPCLKIKLASWLSQKSDLLTTPSGVTSTEDFWRERFSEWPVSVRNSCSTRFSELRLSFPKLDSVLFNSCLATPSDERHDLASESFCCCSKHNVVQVGGLVNGFCYLRGNFLKVEALLEQFGEQFFVSIAMPLDVTYVKVNWLCFVLWVLLAPRYLVALRNL